MGSLGNTNENCPIEEVQPVIIRAEQMSPMKLPTLINCHYPGLLSSCLGYT